MFFLKTSQKTITYKYGEYHAENRYDRLTSDVQKTGKPSMSVRQYVTSHPEVCSTAAVTRYTRAEHYGRLRIDGVFTPRHEEHEDYVTDINGGEHYLFLYCRRTL